MKGTTSAVQNRSEAMVGRGKADVQPQRIRFVIGSLMRGGAETHLVQLLPALKARGHDVAVFAAGPRGSVADELSRQGIAISPLKPIEIAAGLPARMRRVARFCVFVAKFSAYAFRNRKCIFHVFLPETVIVCGILLFPFRRRLIVSQRSMMNYRAKYPAFVTRLERFVFRTARLVLANSEAVVKELRMDGVCPKKIRLIYNGLSDERLSPADASRAAARAAIGVETESLVFIILANLFVYKGYVELIQALSSIRLHLPQKWYLVCIGRDITEIAANGQHTSNLKLFGDQARAAGLDGHILFLGERLDAPALLRAADIGVLPSHEEGFSNALIEMMAAGLPVVATDVGGAKEALQAGQCGTLVPPQNPAALAEALAGLANNAARRDNLGAKARVRACDQYAIEKCADAYEAVYRSIAN